MNTTKTLMALAAFALAIGSARAQTYRLNIYPNSQDLSNPLGAPRIVTGPEALNAHAFDMAENYLKMADDMAGQRPGELSIGKRLILDKLSARGNR
jgi:hypothetical protein